MILLKVALKTITLTLPPKGIHQIGLHNNWDIILTDSGYPVKALWFYYSQRLLNYFSFQYFDFMCTLRNRGGQFYWWRKPEYQEKTIDLPQVTDKLYHIMQIHLVFLEYYHVIWLWRHITVVDINTGHWSSCPSPSDNIYIKQSYTWHLLMTLMYHNIFVY
jgi:hypothetical protein